MFFTKKEVTANASTSKAMHTAFLFTEWLFDSKHFFFAKQKINFLSTKREIPYGPVVRLVTQVQIVLKVVFNQKPHDLRLSFVLQINKDSNEWEIHYNTMKFCVDGFHSPIGIVERPVAYGDIEFEPNGFKNQLLFQEFYEPFLETI